VIPRVGLLPKGERQGMRNLGEASRAHRQSGRAEPWCTGGPSPSAEGPSWVERAAGSSVITSAGASDDVTDEQGPTRRSGAPLAKGPFRPASEDRPRPAPLYNPPRPQARDHHLDRTHLLPAPPAPSSPRPIDPHRIRDQHDHTPTQAANPTCHRDAQQSQRTKQRSGRQRSRWQTPPIPRLI